MMVNTDQISFPVSTTRRIVILAIIGTCIVLCGLWVLSGYLPTMNIETPAYTVVETAPDYEVRYYEGYVVAETRQAGSHEESLSSGFNELFRYISGNNNARSTVKMTAPVLQSVADGGQKIPMAAPVIKAGEGEASTIAFVMPAGLTPEELPVPGSPRVILRIVPPHTVATVTFSGYATSARIAGYTEKLLAALRRDGRELLAAPRVALYNPPWTPPFMRRNEVQVDIHVPRGMTEDGTD